MTPSRLRGLLLGATALLAGVVFLGWSQPWFTLALTASSGDPAPLEVRGDVAASALVPLALTLLAIVAALALAGPVLRTVFGVLEALVGGCVVAVAAVTLADPVAASAPAITEVTGVGGPESIAELVQSVTTSGWPAVSITGGALAALVGILVAITARRWPVSGRRYTRTRIAPADAASDAVSEWDALSGGDDPTAPSR
jgi:uncharacterized membrane protein (TIGR02234 family)